MTNKFSLPPDARARQQMLDQRASDADSGTNQDRTAQDSQAVSVAEPPADKQPDSQRFGD